MAGMYLTGYSDYLTGFREPLSPPYTVIEVIPLPVSKK